MSDTGGGIGENAPFTTANSAQKKETASAHDISIPGEDEDRDHEILHPYYDVEDEQPTTVVNRSTKEDEDEEKSTFVPFMPMPASGSAQPSGSVPLVQGTLHANHVPYVNNTPPMLGQSAPRVAQSSGSHAPHFAQPAQPVHPPPASPFAPRHETIPPPQPPRQPHRFLRHNHVRPTWLVVVVASSILVSIILGIIIAFFPKTSHAPSPVAELIGAPILGKAVILHGGNFAPGETATYTIDAKLSASSQANSPAGTLNSMNVSALLFAPHTEQSPSLRHEVVNSDGTFNATIFIDPSWSAGSIHTVYVYNHDGKLIRSLPFTVVVPIPQTGLVGCVNGADPIILGPISEGSKQRVSKAVTLCTTGSGLVNWTARWDPKWLQINHTGQILAPQHGQLTLNASANGLKPGAYPTTVTFSSKQSKVKIQLSVTLKVKKAPSAKTSPAKIECVSATPLSLYFTNLAKQNNTLLQRVTLNNCGDSGTWSASAFADSGKQWLGIDSSRGPLQSGGLQEIIIAASSANLQPGTYTGHVTFSIGSSNVEVQVTFTVRPPKAPPCIYVNTQSLIFIGYTGQSDPSSQQVTLVNCGVTGHWATSIVTDDGANWLSINPANGSLKGGWARQVSVIASSTELDKGAYTGHVTFAMGSSIITVNVTLIVKPRCIQAGPQSLYFESIARQDDPSAQYVTIANCGAAGEWFGSVSTDNGGNWLSINQSAGHLNEGIARNIAVKVSGTQLVPGRYTGQIWFAMGSKTAPVQVTFTVRDPNECISVNPDGLNFTSTQDRGDPDSQTVTIGSWCNRETWSSSIFTDNGTQWIRTGMTGGELKRGATQDISISLSTVGLSLGKHVGYITFSIGSSSKNVQITLIVHPEPPTACINADPQSLTFTSTTSSISFQESGPKSRTVKITNCGDAGHWNSSILTDDGKNWLRVKPSSGYLQANESADVSITVDSSGPETGTYTATIPFKITIREEATDTARVRVSLTVSQSTSHECKVNPPSLTFTSEWGKDLPAARNVTLTHCGANDSLTESDDSNTSLDIFPRSGNLDSKGSQVVSVRIDDSPTIPPKSYKYTVAFTTGNGNMVEVPVTWNLHAPPDSACIQPDTSSLSFSVTQGGNEGTGSNFINCGASTGKVSVEQSSSDGANWLTVRSLDGSGPYLSGYGPRTFVGLDSTNLEAGKTYTGSIKATITTAQGSHSSVTVGVTLNVLASSKPTPVLPVQSDTSTVLPTQTQTVTLVCVGGRSCVVQTITPWPTDTSTVVVSPTDTTTPSPTDTTTPSPTDTSTPGVTPTDTPTPTQGVTPTATPTPTPTQGITPTDTPTPTPTSPPAPTPTDTPTPEPTLPPAPTPTDTPTPGVTPTGS